MRRILQVEALQSLLIKYVCLPKECPILILLISMSCRRCKVVELTVGVSRFLIDKNAYKREIKYTGKNLFKYTAVHIDDFFKYIFRLQWTNSWCLTIPFLSIYYLPDYQPYTAVFRMYCRYTRYVLLTIV